MRRGDIVRRAGRNLKQARARTILTSLAIGVGAFTIALAMAAGNGGRQYIDSVVSGEGDMQSLQVVRAEPELTTTPKETEPRKLEDSDKMEGSTSEPETLSSKDVTKIAEVDGVRQALPILTVDVSFAAANESDKYEAQIMVQNDQTKIDIEEGSLGNKYQIAPSQIVLPHAYIKAFGFDSGKAAVGKPVTLGFVDASEKAFQKTFTIAAVSKESESTFAGSDASMFMISNQDGQEIADRQRPSGQPESYYSIMAITDDNADIDQVKERIKKAGSYEVFTFADLREGIMQAVNVAQYGLMAFGALAILASIFGIINTQYISVLERTQQIGLMKALGARRKDIAKMFRYESALIGFLGGMVGVGLAFLVTFANSWISSSLGLGEDVSLLKMDWTANAVLVIGLMLVAVISGWFPSRRAAKLDPIEALRTD